MGRAGNTEPGCSQRDGAIPVEQPVQCTLVVPCHNEARSIAGCLDALRHAPLPIGAVWKEWVVIDDASSDDTSAQVRRWQHAHPEVDIDLREHRVRTGKAAGLEAIRAELAGRDSDTVMIVCDADGVVGTDALSLLVAPFVEEKSMAVTWGWSTPRGPRRRRLASRFQAVVSEEQARSLPVFASPAFGRLFAIRPRALPAFRWEPGFVSDDILLAEHVRAVGARRRLVPAATIAILPAAGFRDFYLQTYRTYASRAAVHSTGLDIGSDNGRSQPEVLRVTVSALMRAVRREPAGLPAYLVARLVAFMIHRVRPASFSDAWVISASTK